MGYSRYGGTAKGGRAIQDAGVLGRDINAAKDAIANMLMGLGESAQPMIRQFGRQIGLLPETASAGARVGTRQLPRAAAPRPSSSAYRTAQGLLGGEARPLRTGRVEGSPSPRPAFGPGAAEAPSQPLIDRLMPITRTAEGAPTAPVAPGRPITPIEGTQLDLFSGFNRLRYPAGTKTAEGVSIGGTTYSPNIRMPESESTKFVRDWARSVGLDEDVALEAMRRLRPGPSLFDEVDFASIQPETGFFRTMQGPDLPPGGIPQRAPRPAFGPGAEVSAPTDIAVDRAFALGRAPGVEELTVLRDAAGGLRQVDLGRLAPYVGIAGIGGLAAGTYLYQQQNPRVGEPTETMEPGGIQPLVSLDPGQTPGTLPIPGEAGGGLPPVAGRTIPGQIGAGSETIRLSGARQEALNEARQNAAAVAPSRLTKPQEQLLQYYRQREAFASDPRTQKGVLSEFASLGGRYGEQDMVAWAKANPELAYELVERMKGTRPAPSQQMPQPVQAGPTMTELGSNTRNNSMYNAFAAGQAAVEPTQAAADLRDATDPKYVPQQLMGPSSNPGYNMYGYPLVNPYI